MLLYRTGALLAVACTASAAIIGESIDAHYDKSTSAGVAERSLTNAERFAAGMVPAMPRALAETMPRRSRKQASRVTRAQHKRAPACASGAPIVFPTHPTQSAPQTLWTDVDDSYVQVTLPFSVQIFDITTTVIYVATNGFVSSQPSSSTGGSSLPTTSIPGASVMPFWDDLIVRNGAGQAITLQNSATDVSIRWRTSQYYLSDRTAVNLDFWASRPASRGSCMPLTWQLYYSTSTPGRWYAYYDYANSAVEGGTGSSATIGAQGTSGSGLYTQYSYDTAGAVQSGTRLAFDTQCSGSVTVSQAPTRR